TFLNKNIEYKYSNNLKGLELTTISRELFPEELFKQLVKGRNGHFSLIALTLKMSAVLNMELFDIELRIGEDTDFIWRLALYRNLVPGNIHDAVAVRTIHGNNHILK